MEVRNAGGKRCSQQVPGLLPAGQIMWEDREGIAGERLQVHGGVAEEKYLLALEVTLWLKAGLNLLTHMRTASNSQRWVLFWLFN